MDLLKTILCLPHRTPERINVTIHPGENGFDIPFPFGTIVVPDTPDGSVSYTHLTLPTKLEV